MISGAGRCRVVAGPHSLDLIRTEIRLPVLFVVEVVVGGGGCGGQWGQFSSGRFWAEVRLGMVGRCWSFADCLIMWYVVPGVARLILSFTTTTRAKKGQRDYLKGSGTTVHSVRSVMVQNTVNRGSPSPHSTVQNHNFACVPTISESDDGDGRWAMAMRKRVLRTYSALQGRDDSVPSTGVHINPTCQRE